jgi:hypothetical protein
VPLVPHYRAAAVYVAQSRAAETKERLMSRETLLLQGLRSVERLG